MSRFGDGDYEPVIDKRGREIDTSGLWRGAVKRALAGKRGQAALRDLRDALLALPEKRLIEGALCTVGLSERIEAMPETVIRQVTPIRKDADGKYAHDATGGVIWEDPRPEPVHNYERDALIEFVDEHQDQPEGVCAVGAYVWWQKVKAGADPTEAFATLPTLPDTDAGDWDTAQAGQDAGLTMSLAWKLAYLNDEGFGGLTAEARYERFMAWLDRHIVVPA